MTDPTLTMAGFHAGKAIQLERDWFVIPLWVAWAFVGETCVSGHGITQRQAIRSVRRHIRRAQNRRYVPLADLEENQK